jgi:hypothetical protein
MSKAGTFAQHQCCANADILFSDRAAWIKKA